MSRRMQQVDLPVFDLDGTLVRLGDDLITAVNHALRSLGCTLHEPEAIRGFVGDSVNDVLLARKAGALGCALLGGMT
jgi:phosphoglycolate phosphatase-like HAD superfamily hydrolase